MSDDRWIYVVWGLMALLLVGTGLARVARRQPTQSGAPGMLASAAIWIGAILLIILLYQGVAFWSALGSLFR